MFDVLTTNPALGLLKKAAIQGAGCGHIDCLWWSREWLHLRRLTASMR
jgi:hypothetical protein